MQYEKYKPILQVLEVQGASKNGRGKKKENEKSLCKEEERDEKLI